MNPCGTMRRCICCWSRASRAAALPFASVCPTDRLDLNWQRLIFTHLLEKPHLGVLTGSPITDIKITLLTGRAHEKHTEGGDFRQATYRAVRQGLMQAESVLLEPWYRFRLEVPSGQVGRAMTDLQQMGGKVDAPETMGRRRVSPARRRWPDSGTMRGMWRCIHGAGGGSAAFPRAISPAWKRTE